MKVIWAKEKLQDLCFSNNSIPIHARASGDGASAPGRCCRLCGGEHSLRRVGDTCVWEGVEERYDQLLGECFGVRVTPSDTMICDKCVTKLRNTQKFRALVHAAFERPISDCSSARTAIAVSMKRSDSQSLRRPILRIPTKNSMDQTSLRHILEQPDTILNIIKSTEDQVNVNKKILEMLSKKAAISNEKKQRLVRRTFTNNSAINVKRTIVNCTVCGQRYPMIMPADESKTFVCSRCKLKKNVDKRNYCRKCNIVLPVTIKEHSVQHAKGDMRGRGRLNSLPKKPPQVKNAESAVKSIRSHKSYCSRCQKKGTTSRQLVDQLRNIRSDNADFKCTICNKVLKTRYLLDQHLKLHTGEAVFECDICKRVFKGRHALQLHYLTHENFRPS